MKLTQEIAELILDTSFEKLPEDAVEITRNCFLDTLGVGLAGLDEPASQIAQGYVKEAGGKAEATVIGSDFKTTSPLAAFANGVISHALDYDDNTWAYIGHPSAVIMPAVLAVGEKVKAPGKDMITAYVTGFETACRIGALVTPSLSEIGWHTTPTVGIFGAVAAAGKLLKLNGEEMLNALGIATSESAGVKVNFGTMTKPYHAGKAAHDGVMAALMAKKGFTSAGNALEHNYGFLKVFGNRKTAPSIKEKWGSPFAVIDPGVVFKKFPSCTGTHPSVDAVISLAKQYNIKPEDVDDLSAGSTPEVPREVFYPAPRTSLEAKFSMEFCVSTALIERDLKLSHFTGEYIERPQVKALMKKCRYYVAEELTKPKGIFSPAGVVEIRLKNGKTYKKTVNLARGNPGNSLSQEELTGKFKDCSAVKLSRDKADRLLDALMNLEKLDDAGKLMELTR